MKGQSRADSLEIANLQSKTAGGSNCNYTPSPLAHPPTSTRTDSGFDVRHDPAIGEQVVAFLKTRAVRSTVVADGIIGCPHEEGVDYPEGKYCPQRLTGRGVIAGPRSEFTERIAAMAKPKKPSLAGE